MERKKMMIMMMKGVGCSGIRKMFQDNRASRRGQSKAYE
jgi:hypothetical protein